MKQAAQTSVKVATLTGAAKDDTFNGVVYEDGGTYTLDVLANDPGAARLYSVSQDAGALAGTAQFPVATSTTLASGASVSIADGRLVYDAGTAFQSLGAGVVGYDTFVYTVRMANGALSTATATVAVTGVNDAASISGTGTGSASEDGTLSAGGSLAVSDVDAGENVFAAVDAAALAGTYGDFTFSGGAWTYTLRNGDANVQGLRGGEQVAETLQVGSLDTTASATIAVTVTGLNDQASITGGAAGDVTEDGTLTAGGTLAVSDVDLGEALFAAVDAAALAGTYGDFTFDGGAWTYTLRNGDTSVQALAFGQQVSDTLTVGSVDGTASQAITVTINGADEALIQQDPADPDPTPQDPAYQFSLNRNNVTGGESAIAFVNGVAVLDYFTSNDSVIWRNQDFTSITEVNAGGNTSISYQWQTGNNSGTVTLTLIGVGDVVISGNTLAMAA